MNYKDAYERVIKPGLALLPAKMNTPEAVAMLLAIGMQESAFKERKQIIGYHPVQYGAARGFFGFEEYGGVKGVANHKSTGLIALGVAKELAIRLDPVQEVRILYDALTYNDPLACVFARLLLWTDAHSLPGLSEDTSVSWNYYIRNWRPGKPKRDTWDAHYAHAVAFVNQLSE